MRNRACVWVAVLVGCLGLWRASGFAQEKKPYAKGDIVKVKYVGEVVTGKVVSAKLTGFIDVEFDWKGKKLSKSFPLTLVEGKAPATASTKPAPGSKTPAPAKPLAPGKTPLPVSGDEPELRTWTSDTGKFTIEATFGGLEDGKVKLLKQDGTTTLVPLEKLSEADQELAHQLASAESPFRESPEDEAENPFKEVPDSDQPVDSKPETDPKSGATPPKTPKAKSP